MELYFKNEEVAELESAAERILRIISYAQGRADSYAARRDDFKIIDFVKSKGEQHSQTETNAYDIIIKTQLWISK